MSTPLERIRELKTSAKNQRDRGARGFPSALSLLREAISLAESELATTSVPERRQQAAAELSDCHGLVGGVERRWADALSGDEQREHLLRSVRAYDQGFVYEGDPQWGIVNSYSLVNRLVLRLLLAPTALGSAEPLMLGDGIAPLVLDEQLEAAARTVRQQIAGPRHGDVWALADLALLEVLLGRLGASAAYRGFLALPPPDFACASALGGLRPLAALPIGVAPQLQAAASMLQARLDQLRR